MSLQISIGRLLAVVATCGVGFGAFREASDLWAAGLFALAMGTLGLAGLGAMLDRGPRRARFIGFASLGWAYATLAFAPWFSSHVQPILPTTWAIDQIPQPTTNIPIGILACPDDDTIVPGPGSLSYVVNTGWPRPAPIPAPLLIMSYRHWVGHSLFALVAGLLGSLIGRGFARFAMPRP